MPWPSSRTSPSSGRSSTPPPSTDWPRSRKYSLKRMRRKKETRMGRMRMRNRMCKRRGKRRV
jgi:hypothetical protein